MRAIGRWGGTEQYLKNVSDIVTFQTNYVLRGIDAPDIEPFAHLLSADTPNSKR